MFSFISTVPQQTIMAAVIQPSFTWFARGPLGPRPPLNFSLWITFPANHPLLFLALEGLLDNRQNPTDLALRDLYFFQVAALFLGLLEVPPADLFSAKTITCPLFRAHVNQDQLHG